jgi:hypothetical protein
MSLVPGRVLRRMVSRITDLVSGALLLDKYTIGLAVDDDTLVARNGSGNFHYFMGSTAIEALIEQLSYAREPVATYAALPSDDPEGSFRCVLDENSFYYFTNGVWRSKDSLTIADFIPQDLAPAWKEGRVFYDANTHTLNVYDDVTGTTLNVGTETRIRVRNRTGATSTNGTFVYVSGVTGQIPEITKAIASAQKANEVIGCMTHDIADNGFGWVTVIGSCGDLNTSGFPDGSKIYLSGTSAGDWSLTPYAENSICLGVVLYEHGTQGKILCRPSDANNYFKIYTASKLKLFNGFVDSNRGVTYDHINRTWTLTGTGTTEICWNGEIKNITLPWTSPAHAATVDTFHFLYSSDGTNYVTSVLPWEYWYIQVAGAFYDTNPLYRFGVKETHGATQSHEDHRQNHQARGTYRVSGGTLTAGSYLLEPASPTNAGNRPLFDATAISDEDLQVTNAASTTESYTRFWASADGSKNWALTSTDIVGIGTTYPLWDNEGTQTELSTNKFLWVYRIEIPATDDAQSQQFRTVMISGSEVFSTKAEALLGSIKYRIGNLLAIAPEFVCVHKILIETSASYSTTGKFRIVAEEPVEGTRISSVQASSGAVTSVNGLEWCGCAYPRRSA